MADDAASIDTDVAVVVVTQLLEILSANREWSNDEIDEIRLMLENFDLVGPCPRCHSLAAKNEICGTCVREEEDRLEMEGL